MSKKGKKRVLIITYYWPPSGGIGVLRCLKFAKYLRKYDWEPVIFTAENAHYPNIDHSNEKDVPDAVEIIRQRIWEPYSLFKFFTGKKKNENVNNFLYLNDKKMTFMDKLSIWIRSNFFIPDARAFWINPSVNKIVKYLEKNPVDAILTDGPPHSNTRIATLVKQKTGTPWLADFQDPWTQVDYFQNLILTSWGRKKHERLEQEAFAAADAMTIVSPSWKKDLEKIGAKNVAVVPWGYDPEDFQKLDVPSDKKFTLIHTGIVGPDRLPEQLYHAIKELSAELDGFEEAIELNFYGQVDFVVSQKAKATGVESLVHLKGAVPRREALERCCAASVLLLLLNQQDNVMGRIPGKLFEYLAAGRPILVLGPPTSDVAKIIAETKRGAVVNYGDKEGIKQYLKKCFKAYQQKDLQKPLTTPIDQYSSENLTGKIANLLTSISKY